MTGARPTVSFVIPTSGDPSYVLQALDSVIGQTHGADEILVAVDGPSDAASKAIRRAYPDVSVIPAPGRRTGAAATRNRAIRAATGDWIFFLDHDDLAPASRVEVSLAYLDRHPGCRAVRAPFWIFSETETGPDHAWGMQRDFVAPDLDACEAAVAGGRSPINDFSYLEISGRSRELLLINNRGAISTSAIYRETIMEAGLPPDDLWCADDWTLFVNVSAVTEWELIGVPLGFQRLHRHQHTRTPGLSLAHGIIDAKRKVWDGEESFRLADYGVEYRQEIHGWFVHALRTGQYAQAAAIIQDGASLLPRRLDRLMTLAPARLSARCSKPRKKVRSGGSSFA